MDAYFVAVGITALIYVLLALGLNLQYGFTGLINFGHVGFFAIGAYTSALLALNAWPLPLTIACAAVLAALAAYPIGLVALRLRDDYLAIVTLGFSETVRLAIQQEAWLTNGVQGLPGIPRMLGDFGIGTFSEWGTLGLLLVLNGIAVWLIVRMVKSPFGRLIEAVRDDEDAVRALGKDPARFKVQVLMIGAALAGVAGAMQAHYITYISPEMFVPLVTFYVWMAIIMGGAGRVSGAVVGTLILIGFLEGSRFLRDLPGLSWISEVQMASVRLAVVGLVLVLFTLYRPQGLMGDFSTRGRKA